LSGTEVAAPYGLSPLQVPAASAPSRSRPITTWKRLIVLAVAALAIGLGLAKLFFAGWSNTTAAPERRVAAMVLAESRVKFGLLVTSVRPGSPAVASGLRPYDIITSYGDAQIQDATSWQAAVAAKASERDIALTLFRDGNNVVLTVPPGRLGFRGEDWNPARRRIYERLSFGDRPGAQELAANAERDGALTPAQSLTVKILLIPNRSPAEKEREREELLDALMSIYPMNDVGQLGYSEFFALRSYAAAARCFEEQLARLESEDVGVRLNLATCYVQVFDFDRADRHVHYVVDRKDAGLSAHGVHVAHQVLGGIALGRGRHREALNLFSMHLGSGKECDDHTLLMAMLAAARLNDLRKFREIQDFGIAQSPEFMKRVQFYVDCLHAYALAGNGKNVEAVALVRKWGTDHCIVETAAPYWEKQPGGDDIARSLEAVLKKTPRDVPVAAGEPPPDASLP
jgi:hypothetical protein